MADPNTQIDWWIAQTWQEAQGGADTGALVSWLHENGLSAPSSYTILQAALNCAPEEAKQVVFGHPIWAGQQPDADLANLGYTSETLEPEPEPDPAFELDNWADEVEEDEPVYGEAGYKVNPEAGAMPPPVERPDLDGLGEDIAGDLPEDPPVLTEPAEFTVEDDPEPRFSNPDEISGFDPDDEDMPYVATDTVEPEPDGGELQPGLAVGLDPAGVDSGSAAFEMPQAALDERLAEQGSESEAGYRAETFEDVAPLADPLASAREPLAAVPESAPDPASEFSPEPAAEPAPMAAHIPGPAAAAATPPPILRMPPSTPAERAAVFANAFGKKPVGGQPGTTRPSAATATNDAGTQAPPAPSPQDVAAPRPRYGGPPASEVGPASHADTAPALTAAVPPQADTATVAMPPPLVYEPLPEVEVPAPIAPAEPLFNLPARDPRPAEPLFKRAEAGQADDAPAADLEPVDEADADDRLELVPEDAPVAALAAEDPMADVEPESLSEELDVGEVFASDLDVDDAEQSEAESHGSGDAIDVAEIDVPEADRLDQDEADVEPVEITEPEIGEATLEEESDPVGDRDENLLPADVSEALGDQHDLPPGIKAALEGAADSELTLHQDECDREDYEDIDDDALSQDLSDPGAEPEFEGAGAVDEDMGEDRRPQKRVLLDPAIEDVPHRTLEEAVEVDEEEDLTEAARKLGINFRAADPDEAEIDPDMAKTAQELGISFREGASVDLDSDETALAAQKLGISFREDDSATGKPAKPLLVKYLPMIFGIFIIFILLLIGATYAGSFIGWLKNG